MSHKDLAPSVFRRVTDSHGHIAAERIRDAPHAGSQRSIRVYRVRWIGFDSDHDSWIRKSLLLEDVPDVVAEYEASKEV